MERFRWKTCASQIGNRWQARVNFAHEKGKTWVFNHYTFIEDAIRDRLNDLIKDAERERQAHEFLEAYPEYKTTSRIRAFAMKVLGHSANADDNRNEMQKLQKDAG